MSRLRLSRAPKPSSKNRHSMRDPPRAAISTRPRARAKLAWNCSPPESSRGSRAVPVPASTTEKRSAVSTSNRSRWPDSSARMADDSTRSWRRRAASTCNTKLLRPRPSAFPCSNSRARLSDAVSTASSSAHRAANWVACSSALRAWPTVSSARRRSSPMSARATPASAHRRSAAARSATATSLAAAAWDCSSSRRVSTAAIASAPHDPSAPGPAAAAGGPLIPALAA